jgi:hypothetical protein
MGMVTLWRPAPGLRRRTRHVALDQRHGPEKWSNRGGTEKSTESAPGDHGVSQRSRRKAGSLAFHGPSDYETTLRYIET